MQWLLLLTVVVAVAALDVRQLQRETRALFAHGWELYRAHGFPADEVTPFSCEAYGPSLDRSDVIRNDALGNASLMVLDNLDLLFVFDRWDDLDEMLAYLKQHQHTLFDQDRIVQVFEFLIRLLGGLLSAHLLLTDTEPTLDRWRATAASYDGFLLRMATTLGNRLISAYKTTTNLPVPRINLARGAKAVPRKFQREGCTAGVTTPVLEMTLLLRLTGNPKYEKLSQRAFWKLWELRSLLGLLPMSLDPVANKWVDAVLGIGALIDLFYEYAVKLAILFNDARFWTVWDTSYRALLVHLAMATSSTMVFRNISPYDGTQQGMWIDSLLAFWPGVQVLAGRVDDARRTHTTYRKVWNAFGLLPERWNYEHAPDPVALEWYALRPEFIESTYYLYRATKDPFYLHIGAEILRAFQSRFKAPCGFAGYQDVRTGERQDRMETFVLGETLKYLYLLFDAHDEHFLHRMRNNWVFSTEAHPLWLSTRSRGFHNATCEVPQRAPVFTDSLFFPEAGLGEALTGPDYLSHQSMETTYYQNYLGPYPVSRRRPTSRIFDMFLGDVTAIRPTDLEYFPIFDDFKIQIEQLLPGCVDSYNTNWAGEPAIRILKVNGVDVPRGDVVRVGSVVKPFSVKKGQVLFHGNPVTNLIIE